MSNNNKNLKNIDNYSYCSYCSYCSSCYSCYSCSSCYSSKNLRMSEYMLFCLGDEDDRQKGEGYQKSYRIFNQDVPKDEWNKINSNLSIKLPLTKWTDKEDMTKEEKDNNSVWEEIGGYLKVLSYEDAWKLWWDNASQKEKNVILDIKYFDKTLFFEITGIGVKATPSLVGKEVEVKLDGRTYKAKIIED